MRMDVTYLFNLILFNRYKFVISQSPIMLKITSPEASVRIFPEEEKRDDS